MQKTFPQRVYALVKDIPAGAVMTYGQIAHILGSPRAARIVGAAMQRAPEGQNLPCHRVIYSDGRLCCFEAFGGYDIQRDMLESEGVTFLPSGRVDLKRHLWPGTERCVETE